MSSHFRKAQLKRTTADRGWVITQRDRGGSSIARAWAFLGDSILEAQRAGDAKSLLEKGKGAYCLEVPDHWLAIPTGFDLQVHLRHPGQPQKETLEGGLESALVGGFDSILTMPNTNPFLDHPEAVKKAVESTEPKSTGYPVRVAVAASATLGMQGERPTDIAALARAGASAITDDGWGVKSAEAQESIFRACAEADILFQQHAEMPGHKGVATASKFQQKTGLPVYPRNAESEMVRRDIEILRRCPGARYHVLHISTRETLEEIRKGKAEGLRITAEVTPHHLFFSNAEIPDESDERCTYFKMNPPLFAPEDRVALREALRDGTIDCVSTDHAPHEFEHKQKGWKLSPFGTRGLETALPSLLHLVFLGELSLPRLIEVFSTSPRRILAKERFSSPTGLLFVDPLKTFSVTESELPGISRNSCFLGSELKGRLELRIEPSVVFERIT